MIFFACDIILFNCRSNCFFLCKFNVVIDWFVQMLQEINNKPRQSNVNSLGQTGVACYQGLDRRLASVLQSAQSKDNALNTPSFDSNLSLKSYPSLADAFVRIRFVSKRRKRKYVVVYWWRLITWMLADPDYDLCLHCTKDIAVLRLMNSPWLNCDWLIVFKYCLLDHTLWLIVK